MKRTNLVLDEQLLHEAQKVLGAKTYSEAVNRSLEETLKMMKVRGMFQALGKATWKGSLEEVREDSPRSKRKPKQK